MSAPAYPVDPNQKAGWAVPGGYPAQPYPNAGYPVQPGYPAQPVYPQQPGYPQAGYPQPGYPQQPGYPPQQGMPNMGFAPRPMANDVYNARRDNDPKDDENALTSSGLGASFDDKAIRHAFVRKVYLILMVQLLVTVGIIALFTFHSGVKLFVQRNMWTMWLSYAVFIVTYLSLVCCSGLRRKWPANFIMLGVFTLALSYMTGAISAAYDTRIVLMTVGITAVICFLISLFAMQTKFDFTGMGTYLFVAGMVLMIFGIIAIFTYSNIMHTIYSAGIALLFSMYLIYDTQMLMGGRKYELSPEEHIFGALTLYIDVVQIFLALLSLSKN